MASMTPPPLPPSSAPPPAPGGRPAGHRPLPGPPAPRTRSSFGRLVLATMTAILLLVLVFVSGVGSGIIGMGAAGFWAAGSTYEHGVMSSVYREGGGARVAIVPIEGVIDGAQAEFVRRSVNAVLDDRSIEAVVLRVDSPGGGVTASDQIWYQVERMRTAGLPVVASFGGVAASGGYYVSCSADHIIAEETCTTGSIGVIAQIMTFEGLMDKVGIEPVTLVARGSPEKGVANDIFRSWSETDRTEVVEMLDSAYAIFTERVASGREETISKQSVSDVADGSVFTASEALTNGLIDAIGYLDDAITHAETVAGIRGRAHVVRYDLPPSLFAGLPLVERSTPSAGMNAESLRSMINELGSVRMMFLQR